MHTDHVRFAPWSRRLCAVALSFAVMLLGATSVWVLGQEATPPAVDPCLVGSSRPPDRLAGTDASPSPELPRAVQLGTPVTQACLTVMLQADSTNAGPRTLTVEVTAADGTPISEAEVIITTRHLEMDHGTSEHHARETEPGRYVAEDIAMGMSGTWEAVVMVTRPAQEPVTAHFELVLEGPD